MIDLEQIEHNKYLEKIVNVVCARTGNSDKNFFRPVSAYFLAKIASNMRANILTRDMGYIPINLYSICLGSSGYGKGHSINIIEDEFLKGFKERFTLETLPKIAQENIINKAEQIASIQQIDLEVSLAKLQLAYAKTGEYVFSFDSGTAPAIKQIRNKLLLSSIGAISSEQDEIGSNLLNNLDILSIFLELFDLGKVKPKLIKNTVENVRDIEFDGRVPANLLMFGTPDKLFDSDIVEKTFLDLLSTGFARRCLFGYGTKKNDIYATSSAKEIYLSKVNAINSASLTETGKYFTELASEEFYNRIITVPDDVSIELTQYKIDCEKQSEQFNKFDFIRKSELEHRYFKTLKLAGVYAFLNNHQVMEMLDLHQAIKLVEECGKSFDHFIKRDPDYVRVAKFILESKKDVTNAEITEALPFYKTQTKRKELITYAKSWGYTNNILLKQDIKDGIEFFSASSLNETDLDKLFISYSAEFADNFKSQIIKFDSLENFCTGIDATLNWCNHSFKDNKRNQSNIIEGFNLIVLDCDSTISIENFKKLFSSYTYILHTTKRHTAENNRFRVIIPLKYQLFLSRNVYKEFMGNILKWLPFSVDDRVTLPEQKWLTNPKGESYKHINTLFDPLNFIPKTIKNDTFNSEKSKIKNLDKLQSWFCQLINEEGNRNNNLFNYGCMLIDSNTDYETTCNMISSLNKTLNVPLSEAELNNTIFKSLANKVK